MRFCLILGSLTLSIILVCTSLSEVRADSQDKITKTSSYLNDSDADITSTIQDVIESQLRAFRERKSHDAYALNAQSFKDQYRNEDHFMTMIRITHKPIAAHVSYRFLDHSKIGEKLIQKVRLTNKDGSNVTAFIHLKHNETLNTWVISGYTLLDAQDAQPI